MKKKQNGVALVEFALILPLLLILTFITTEFGRALYQYNTIAKSLRDASRYLSTQDPSIATTDPAKITTAKNLVVFGNPAGGVSPLVLGLEISHVPDPTWQFKGSGPAMTDRPTSSRIAERCTWLRARASSISSVTSETRIGAPVRRT